MFDDTKDDDKIPAADEHAGSDSTPAEPEAVDENIGSGPKE